MFTRHETWFGSIETRRTRWFATCLAILDAAMARRAQRRQLATLDARLLRDIGITRYDAAMEAAKPVWRR